MGRWVSAGQQAQLTLASGFGVNGGISAAALMIHQVRI
jgi:hypothetical protein